MFFTIIGLSRLVVRRISSTNRIRTITKFNGSTKTQNRPAESTDSAFPIVETELKEEIAFDDGKKGTNGTSEKNDEFAVEKLKIKAFGEPASSLSAKSDSNQNGNETPYYFENGLRKVYPYHYTYTAFAKRRWLGEQILDVVRSEFHVHPAKDYKQAIMSGIIRVNDEPCAPDYRLQHGDRISNSVHRHELPVLAQPIKIVHLDDDICVIDKPTSIPFSPVGRYRHNTVLSIMANEFNLRKLHAIHRLDRLTSGILMIGRTMETGREMQRQMASRQVQKEYVCRVVGDFPTETIQCNEPIDVISTQVKIYRISANGKESSTIFEKLRYNSTSNTSVVLCKPLTGRTHQIRVHLQYLGYPIVNDPVYNHSLFGPSKGKDGDLGGQTDQQFIENWMRVRDIDLYGTNSDENVTETKSTRNEKLVQTFYDAPTNNYDSTKLTVDPNCLDCKHPLNDPQMVMHLHALKYSGQSWNYETEMPFWATENFEV